MPKTKNTNLDSIRDKVTRYHEKMNAISKFLDKHNAPPGLKINMDDQFIQFYIDQKYLNALNDISGLDGFDHLGVFFGIDNDKKGKVTACFLGMDDQNKILDQHKQPYKSAKGKITQAEPGQEDWPPPYNMGKTLPKNCFNLRTDIKVILKFLSK